MATTNAAAMMSVLNATPTGAIWTETFSLKHGQSINFTGLPENTTYVVSEDDYAAERCV